MNQQLHDPPKLPRRFLEWFCPDRLLESIEGDLVQQFDEDVAMHGLKRARLLFFWNVIRFFRPEIILRNKFKTLISTIMIGNYLKVASRNILKRKLYSFINAFGLSVAIAFCVLIYIYVEDEKSFDQFHENKDQIYRVYNTGFDSEAFEKGSTEPYTSHAYLPAPLGERMLEEMPEVVQMTRFNSGRVGVMKYNDKIFKQTLCNVDSGFFNMFTFPVLRGAHRHQLANLYDMVVTDKTAKKYFGDEDPIGKTVTVDMEGSHAFTITAVIASPPANSSLTFEALIREDTQEWFSRNQKSWGNYSYPTFVMVRPGTNMANFNSNLDSLVEKYMGDRFKKWREEGSVPAQFFVGDMGVNSLNNVHLDTKVSWERSSDPKYSMILGGIALFILLIACINYVSLALTTSTARRIEVGIRKVVGAHRRQLMYQFGLESVLLAIISMVIGLGIVLVSLPAFNEFTGKAMVITGTHFLQITGVSIVVAVIVGMLAGLYPSLFLSGFLPALVLKGRFTSRLQAGFTRPLVVMQFTLSAILIITSLIMYRQMRFITTKDLGFNKDQVLVLDTNFGWTEESDRAIDQFRNKVRGNPGIEAVSGTSSSFNQGWSRYGYKIKDEHKSAYVYRIDTDYIPLLGIELVAGRNFDPARPADSTGIIVNEALVKDMGWKNPTEEYLNYMEDTVGLGAPVIGVAKDYHFQSLEREIEPMFMSMSRKHVGYLTTMLVKLKAGDIANHAEEAKKAWLELFPDKPFEYSFVDQDVARQYETYQRWMNIMGAATGFGILIACLGLFGLSGINAVNRTREIGIRKVMGAELSNIFFLLNKQYIFLALISFFIAAPVSWWFVTTWWLKDFQFKVAIGWELFAVSMIGGLIVALLTVSYHAIRAALANPAETLKYE